MKPTSIIFIILSAILIFTGIVLCLVGGGMAKSEDTQLLCDRVDENGDAVSENDLLEYNITAYSINMKNVNVNIIGKSTKTYIEFKNINRVTYDFTVSNHKLNLSTINPFNPASLVKIRENGLGFDGLRHYLFLNKYKNKTPEVNIYLSPEQTVTDIKVRVTDGNITIKDMTANCTYDVGAKNGTVKFEETDTNQNISAKAVGGDFIYDSANAKSLEFEVENGHADFKTTKQYNYTIDCEHGKIYIDNENVGESFAGVYPETKQSGDKAQEVTLPDSVRGKITSGDMSLKEAEQKTE